MFVIPFISSMLLGTAYNYNKAQVGVDVFSRDTVGQNTRTIQRAFTKSEFKMIRSNSDVKDILDVNGELSLKVMADLVNVEGSGSYLKQTHDRTQTVEIVCHLVYETITETLLSEADPMPNWQNNLGSSTHFVRSIMYGGELVASLKFSAEKKESLTNIEAALKASVGIEGTLDVSVGGKLKKLAEDNSNDVSLTINYYATTRVEGVPQNIDGLTQLISDFPEHVKKVNNGNGNPLRVELYPLASLESGSNIATFIRNAAVAGRLNEVRDKYLDIKTAHKETSDWFSSLNTRDNAILQRVSDFYTLLDNVSREFYSAIVAMDISTSGDATQFDAALAKYREGGQNIAGKYVRMYKKIRTEITELLNRDCYGNPLHNVGMARGNLINTGEAERVSGAMSQPLCQQKCDEKTTCKSYTFTRLAGTTNTQLATGSKCWLNLVDIGVDSLIPVPHLTGTEIYIYVKEPGCTPNTL